MEGTVLAAIITGAVALVVVSVTPPITYFFSRKRDHEADWRKMKLEQYKEYVTALSGTVHHPYDSAVQRRYTDAVNSIGLIAPPKVLIALYRFLDETSFSKSSGTISGVTNEKTNHDSRYHRGGLACCCSRVGSVVPRQIRPEEHPLCSLEMASCSHRPRPGGEYHAP